MMKARKYITDRDAVALARKVQDITDLATLDQEALDLEMERLCGACNSLRPRFTGSTPRFFIEAQLERLGDEYRRRHGMPSMALALVLQEEGKSWMGIPYTPEYLRERSERLARIGKEPNDE